GGRAGRADEIQPAGRRQDRRVQDLSRRAARLPRRLPPELPQGGRRRCVEPDAGLAEEIQGSRLVPLAHEAGATLRRPLPFDWIRRASRNPDGTEKNVARVRMIAPETAGAGAGGGFQYAARP